MAREYKKSMKPKRKNCVRKLRIYRGIKQKTVADFLNMSYTTYRDIEDNDRIMKLAERKKIAFLLKVNVKQLYEEETND